MKKLFALFIALDRWSVTKEQKLNAFSDRYFDNPIALLVLSILTALLFIGLLYVPDILKS